MTISLMCTVLINHLDPDIWGICGATGLPAYQRSRVRVPLVFMLPLTDVSVFAIITA